MHKLVGVEVLGWQSQLPVCQGSWWSLLARLLVLLHCRKPRCNFFVAHLAAYDNMNGCGSKLNYQGTAGCSPSFHLPGFHFGYIFLTHSHTWTHRGHFFWDSPPKSVRFSEKRTWQQKTVRFLGRPSFAIPHGEQSPFASPRFNMLWPKH